MHKADVNVETQYNDRAARLEFANEHDVCVRVVNTLGDKRVDQFAHIAKENLLDALAQIGWLPEEYLKPEPLDPREAKIQEIVVNLVNADRVTYGSDDPLDSYQELVDSNQSVTPYRNNAEALIDAGLVTVDE